MTYIKQLGLNPEIILVNFENLERKFLVFNSKVGFVRIQNGKKSLVIK